LKGVSYLYCFIAIFFFSTNELVGKIVSLDVSPIMVTVIRFFIGSIIIIPFILKQKGEADKSLRFKDYASMAFPGIINVGLAMLFLQLATYYGKASTSAILISSNPLFVAIFATFILKERLSTEKIAGILLGLVGVYLVIKGEKGSPQPTLNYQLGIIYGVIASIAFGLYTVLAKKQTAKYGNLVFNSVSFGVGAIVLLIVSLIFNLDLSFNFTLKNSISVLYMGIFVTGIAYILYLNGLKNIPATSGSMFFFLKPFIASLLSWIILGEKITPIQLVGIFVIIAGIYVSHLNFVKAKG